MAMSGEMGFQFKLKQKIFSAWFLLYIFPFILPASQPATPINQLVIVHIAALRQVRTVYGDILYRLESRSMQKISVWTKPERNIHQFNLSICCSGGVGCWFYSLLLLQNTLDFPVLYTVHTPQTYRECIRSWCDAFFFHR